MRSIFRSALRILAAVAAVLLAFGWALRQPNIGELPFPQGPRANAALLEGHVRFLASSDHPRNPRHPAALDRAARYIAAEFSRAGAEVSEQPYRAWGVETKNLFTRFGPGQGPRIMVTDTAVWRNPNYHRASDTASSLDYRRMAGVVDAVLSTAIHLAND